MDVFTDNELLEIKSFYINKKETFANTLQPEYYANRKYNGEEFGYTLADPYTEQEIISFEMKYAIKLEPNLKLYLLKVSRELFAASYPSIFELEMEGSCLIPENESIWNAGDCPIHGEYDSVNNTENCSDDCPGMFGGMIYCGMYGCSFDDHIVVKGNHIGSLWNSDGDAIYKQCDTFKQYVYDQIKRSKN